ncbi:hypothetical protein MMC30_006309 [Trapelia coarctata]|nr:hypothetical protein [Trapelia coarctata]
MPIPLGCTKIELPGEQCYCGLCFPQLREPVLEEYDRGFHPANPEHTTEEENAYDDYLRYLEWVSLSAVGDYSGLHRISPEQTRDFDEFLIIEDDEGFPDLYATLPKQNPDFEELVGNEEDGGNPCPNAALPKPNPVLEEPVVYEDDEDLPGLNATLPEPNAEINEIATTEQEEDLPAPNTTLPKPEAELKELVTTQQARDLLAPNTTLSQQLPQPKPKAAKKSKDEKKAANKPKGSKPPVQLRFPKRAKRGPQRHWEEYEKGLAEYYMEEAIRKEKNLNLKHSEKVYDEVAAALTREGFKRSKHSVKNWWSRNGRDMYNLEERDKPKKPGALVTCARDPTKKKRKQPADDEQEEDQDTIRVDSQPKEAKRRKITVAA